MSFESAFGEGMAGMGACVLEGEELIAHTKHADFDAPHENAQSPPWCQCPCLAHPNKRHRISILAARSLRVPNQVILSSDR
jgi:hypothetical protein